MLRGVVVQPRRASTAGLPVRHPISDMKPGIPPVLSPTGVGALSSPPDWLLRREASLHRIRNPIDEIRDPM